MKEIIYKIIDIEWLINLWQTDTTIEWWKMLLIGAALLLMNFGLGLATWYMSKATIVELGYSKRKNKRKFIKKKMESYGFIDKLLLFNLTIEAEKFNPMLILSLIGNFFNVLAVIATVVGFIGCMATLAAGWAYTLLLIPVPATLFIFTAIEFIPSLIWDPSERRRYFGSNKKK